MLKVTSNRPYILSDTVWLFHFHQLFGIDWLFGSEWLFGLKWYWAIDGCLAFLGCLVLIGCMVFSWKSCGRRLLMLLMSSPCICSYMNSLPLQCVWYFNNFDEFSESLYPVHVLCKGILLLILLVLLIQITAAFFTLSLHLVIATGRFITYCNDKSNGQLLMRQTSNTFWVYRWSGIWISSNNL